MSKKGIVYYQDKIAGYISETDDGYEFMYDKKYLLDLNSKTISLTLPLQQEVYKSKTLFPFFDGLIPEGWLLDITTDYWKLKSNDRFELLLSTCRDAIGAVSVIHEAGN